VAYFIYVIARPEGPWQSCGKIVRNFFLVFSFGGLVLDSNSHLRLPFDPSNGSHGALIGGQASPE